jgi:hypothetical protein
MPYHCGLCKFEAASSANMPMRCSLQLLDITFHLCVFVDFVYHAVHHAVTYSRFTENRICYVHPTGFHYAFRLARSVLM